MLLMIWTDKYIGLPFSLDGRSREGLDCWGLVRLVYQEELGIKLPTFSGIYIDKTPEVMRQVADAMDVERNNWNPVTKPRNFDVVLMRVAGRLPTHVGVVCGHNNMLHIMASIHSSVEPLASIIWQKRIVGYYRHANNS